MKRGLFLVPVLFLLCSPCFASLFKSGSDVIINSGENVSGNVYLAGNTVTVNGVINGDAVLMGNSVLVNGLITGDLLVMGSTVSVVGDVNGDVRSGSMSLSVSGVVGGEVLAGAGTVLLNEGSSVGDGVTVACGSLVLAGDVNGNVTVYDGNLTVARTAIVTGFLNYTSDNDAVIMDAGSIGGFVQKNLPASDGVSGWSRDGMADHGYSFWAFSWFWAVISVLSMLVSGYVLLRLSLKSVNDFIDVMGKDVLERFVRGLVFLIVVPIASFIALCTLIAAPLGVIALVLYGVMLYVSWIYAGFFVGRRLLDLFKAGKRSLMTDLLTGAIALTGLSYVPFIGCFVNFVVLVIALGVLVSIVTERYNERRKKKLL